MIPVNQENLARSAAPAPDAAATAPESERHEDTAEDKQEAVVEVKGDPEMAPVFLRHLLPVFTHVFQSAMVQSVRYVSFYNNNNKVHISIQPWIVISEAVNSNNIHVYVEVCHFLSLHLFFCTIFLMESYLYFSSFN